MTKKPEHRYEKMDAPRLDEHVKKMNGRSTRRLHECIDALCDVLDVDSRQEPQDGSVSPQGAESQSE